MAVESLDFVLNFVVVLDRGELTTQSFSKIVLNVEFSRCNLVRIDLKAANTRRMILSKRLLQIY